jgi:hypothetical protein
VVGRASLTMAQAKVRGAVEAVVGTTAGDETILDYIIGVLSDEDFEFGVDGEEAFEAIGPMLVSTQASPMPQAGLMHGRTWL